MLDLLILKHFIVGYMSMCIYTYMYIYLHVFMSLDIYVSSLSIYEYICMCYKGYTHTYINILNTYIYFIALCGVFWYQKGDFFWHQIWVVFPHWAILQFSDTNKEEEDKEEAKKQQLNQHHHTVRPIWKIVSIYFFYLFPAVCQQQVKK